MIIRWEVNDGYAGPSRPQRTKLSQWEVESYNELETEYEKERFLEEIVQEDFDQKITFYIKGVEE